ncbi:hypothetical protein WT14_25770 [Burkholderia stagnalis]|nr:hypothetical protein WT14_25770 [Burkholderia stagnalis]
MGGGAALTAVQASARRVGRPPRERRDAMRKAAPIHAKRAGGFDPSLPVDARMRAFAESCREN